MLTTAPHLYIRRPSPTTAEFTVTTRPPLTLPLRILLLLLNLGRLLLLCASVLTLYARFFSSVSPPPPPPPSSTSSTKDTSSWLPFLSASGSRNEEIDDLPTLLLALLHAASLSPPGALLTHWSAGLPAWAVLALCAAGGYAAVGWRLHTTESVLVLRGLGIQTAAGGAGVSTSGSGSSMHQGWWGSRWGSGWGWGWGWGGAAQTTRFIPTEKIRDVLINEAFRGFEVRYYLVVVVEGEEDVVVLFPGLLPRRKIVEAVWRGVRGCLFEGEGRGEVGLGWEGVDKGD